MEIICGKGRREKKNDAISERKDSAEEKKQITFNKFE